MPEDFEIKGRRPIYVFLRSMKNAKNLNKYGEVIYTSSKGNYACLYVDEEKFEKLLPTLKRLSFVKYVKRGRISELAEDFGAAFAETNREVEAELKAREARSVR